jgi:hypothetical protein
MKNRKRLYAQKVTPPNIIVPVQLPSPREDVFEKKKQEQEIQLPSRTEILRPSEDGSNWNENGNKNDVLGQVDFNTLDSEMNAH